MYKRQKRIVAILGVATGILMSILLMLPLFNITKVQSTLPEYLEKNLSDAVYTTQQRGINTYISFPNNGDTDKYSAMLVKTYSEIPYSISNIFIKVTVLEGNVVDTKSNLLSLQTKALKQTRNRPVK